MKKQLFIPLRALSAILHLFLTLQVYADSFKKPIEFDLNEDLTVSQVILDNSTISDFLHAVYIRNFKVANDLLNKGFDYRSLKPSTEEIISHFVGKKGEIYHNCPNAGLHDHLVDLFIKICKSPGKANILQTFKWLSEGAPLQNPAMIFYAVNNNIESFVSYLLCQGISPNIKLNSSDDTLLHIACKKDFTGIVKLLIENPIEKANLEATSGLEKMTTLHFACEKGNLEMAKLLIQSGANIEATTTAGLTPLHIAAKNLDLNLVEYLMEDKKDLEGNIIPGANTMIRDADEELPIRIAYNVDVTKLIEENSDILLIQEQVVNTILKHMARDAARNAEAEFAAQQQNS